MAVGGQPGLDDVGIDDIAREALLWPHLVERTREVARATVEAMLAAVEPGAIPADGQVGRLVRDRGERMLAGKGAGA